MEENAELLSKRLAELDRRACDSGIYCFTEFLDLAGQGLLPAHPLSALTLWGGFEGAERLIARFAPPDACWEEPFPIVCVRAAPVAGKFAGSLSHRDFLGALMGLGIKRGVIGDILVSGGAGHIACLEAVAPFIAENLASVGRENVACEVLSEMPSVAAPAPESAVLVAASERLDALAASVYKLSRSEAKALFDEGLVFQNGREAAAARDAAPGDIISVRGRGRFVYKGLGRETKKGRVWVEVDIYR